MQKSVQHFLLTICLVESWTFKSLLILLPESWAPYSLVLKYCCKTLPRKSGSIFLCCLYDLCVFFLFCDFHGLVGHFRLPLPLAFFCCTGGDQILTKCAGDSTQHQDDVLSREDASYGARCVCRHFLFTRRAMLSR